MSNVLKEPRKYFDALLVLVVFPLLGITLAGRSAGSYMEFPPLTRYVEHAGFSWPVFAGLTAFVAAVVLPFLVHVLRCRKMADVPEGSHGSFPWWGWLGAFMIVLFWLIAWTRIPLFKPLQLFTFSPIWFGYILVVNAWTLRRSGKCMLLERPLRFVGLFMLSAVFWWYFEYLNRFVQNWYYEGVDELSGMEYFLFATLPFSTVLPAVLGTKDLLATFPRLSAGMDNYVKIRVRHAGLVGFVMFVVSVAGLALIGLYPDSLFPLLWISPLAIITSMQAIRGEQTIFGPLGRGRWREVYLLALSALVCGFFWEMWNFYSAAKWIYAVPYVNRFHLFEMPILGYAGYLPFGLECAVVGDILLGVKRERLPRYVPLSRPRLTMFCKIANWLILLFLSVWFFLMPGCTVVRNLADPGLSGDGIPRIAWRTHRYLTPRIENWARKRIASGKAAHLNLYDVPSTEWPMFGCVYYLWATELLQKAWEKDNTLSAEPPVKYARKTIDAAVDLILDPVHHTWVKTHWGDNYMHRKNVFFRSLIIASLTSHEDLLRTGRHLDVLRDQVETLAAELDASELGVLDDYPGECYPIDVLAAIACVRRADNVLGTDHDAFVKRARRAFTGSMLDERGMVPYRVDESTGHHWQPSRGVGNSYVLIFAKELWPELAEEWYDLYTEYFWQETWWAAGFREFPNDLEGYDWLYDVDAGPVVAGFSPAANAFGVAAARVNGCPDQAWKLGAQVLSACWPLPNGELLGGRFLSSAGHAPYLGESCLLFFFSAGSESDPGQGQGKRIPGFVLVGCGFYFLAGAGLIGVLVFDVLNWVRRRREILTAYQSLQFVLWVVLMCGSLWLVFSVGGGWWLVPLALAQFLPRCRREEQE